MLCTVEVLWCFSLPEVSAQSFRRIVGLLWEKNQDRFFLFLRQQMWVGRFRVPSRWGWCFFIFFQRHPRGPHGCPPKKDPHTSSQSVFIWILSQWFQTLRFGLRLPWCCFATCSGFMHPILQSISKFLKRSVDSILLYYRSSGKGLWESLCEDDCFFNVFSWAFEWETSREAGLWQAETGLSAKGFIFGVSLDVQGATGDSGQDWFEEAHDYYQAENSLV